MKIEHIGYNVSEPTKMADWYVANLGMKIKRNCNAPVVGYFLADSAGQMMLEIYHNPAAAVPDYFNMDLLIRHICFNTDDVEGERQKLIKAGATAIGDIIYDPNGDRITNMRDPWGVPIQLAKRAKAMI